MIQYSAAVAGIYGNTGFLRFGGYGIQFVLLCAGVCYIRRIGAVRGGEVSIYSAYIKPAEQHYLMQFLRGIYTDAVHAGVHLDVDFQSYTALFRKPGKHTRVFDAGGGLLEVPAYYLVLPFRVTVAEYNYLRVRESFTQVYSFQHVRYRVAFYALFPQFAGDYVRAVTVSVGFYHRHYGNTPGGFFYLPDIAVEGIEIYLRPHPS